MLKSIELIEVDELADNAALLLLKEDDRAYFATASVSDDQPQTYFNIYNYRDALINRSDMNDGEWKIAQELFKFLWSSDNGTNTKECFDFLDEEGISYNQLEEFIKKFNLGKGLDLDDYDPDATEDDGVEIYWDFLCRFNLCTCDFFGKEVE